jgi:hypothetical protein
MICTETIANPFMKRWKCEFSELFIEKLFPQYLDMTLSAFGKLKNKITDFFLFTWLP